MSFEKVMRSLCRTSFIGSDTKPMPLGDRLVEDVAELGAVAESLELCAETRALRPVLRTADVLDVGFPPTRCESDATPPHADLRVHFAAISALKGGPASDVSVPCASGPVSP